MQEECIKWCNWFHIFYTKKSCFLLCNYMFIRLIWWKNKSYENSKIWNFGTKDYKGKNSFIKSFGYFFIFIRFKKFNSRCKSHVQYTIMQKNMFSWLKKHILAFVLFIIVKQNIHAQLCTHVKNHHNRMNYCILDYSIFFT